MEIIYRNKANIRQFVNLAFGDVFLRVDNGELYVKISDEEANCLCLTDFSTYVLEDWAECIPAEAQLVINYATEIE